MKIITLSGIDLMNLIICGEQILVFYNKPKKKKNVKRREWENI